MDIKNWVSQVIKGIGGFLSWEEHEMPTYHNTRDEQIAAFVLRCLANPICEGSREVLDAILEQRGGTVPDYGTGFRPPWDLIGPEFVACTIDNNGAIYFWADMPKAFDNVWYRSLSRYVEYPYRVNAPVKNWQECLWIRPGHREKEGAE